MTYDTRKDIEYMKIAVLGAGTWGTALAALLVDNGQDVTLWSAVAKEIDDINATRTHKNLPGTVIPDKLKLSVSIEECCHGAELVLFAVASQYIRSTARLAAPYVEDNALIVSATKGIEQETLHTMTEVLEEAIKNVHPGVSCKFAALSGPTHAEEVAIKQPTSIVAACEDEDVAMRIATTFSNAYMRVYTNTDILGVELAGAYKNIIAIACGINRGMGFGDNSQAMLITRGIAEITRIGLAMGCHRRTFMGLAGIGDLIVTCTSHHSRNNRCGQLIGKGMSYEEAAREIGMVVEGYHALDAAVALAQKHGVEMPLTQAVYSVLKKGMTPKEAMIELMNRDIKSELWSYNG